MPEDILSQERLKEFISYNPDTGIFIRIKSRGSSKKGRIIGNLTKTGYLRARVDKKMYMLHRLAFMYMTGSFPDQVDHENHNRIDNRWCNLKTSSAEKNTKNRSLSKHNTSGFNGVHINKSRTTRKWIAAINVGKKIVTLGSFRTHYAACYARHAANIKYGYHNNHGK